ncbi:hypothetical protein V5O48_015499 [Marasmius crinis-equi]|uniref:Uncharacterized protein n=1 Tax=Marasmius crinis-equi TaxID=585013 RepID=A0ABR3EUD7_9AGAR
MPEQAKTKREDAKAEKEASTLLSLESTIHIRKMTITPAPPSTSKLTPSSAASVSSHKLTSPMTSSSPNSLVEPSASGSLLSIPTPSKRLLSCPAGATGPQLRSQNSTNQTSPLARAGDRERPLRTRPRARPRAFVETSPQAVCGQDGVLRTQPRKRKRVAY